ncbi:hypothetical protein JTE90_005665 [Oedothorax gibbosus]|uniref:Secreted protein n=1 Tax=Oedothorax gibbosus TaxID=931172 RepID=A0AAV6UGI1_9ARAC|nr:hypothetical protein JTE90_005665 [Oedothorax gibbosus]
MRLLFWCFCLLVLDSCTGNLFPPGNLLGETLDALEKGLEYMHRKLDAINLDAVFCVRQAQEQLQSFLDNEPEVFEAVRPRIEKLRDLAKKTADEATPLIKEHEPQYYKVVGQHLKEKKVDWFPSKDTSEDYVVEAVNCSVYHYDWETENDCYNAVSKGKGHACEVPQSCIDLNKHDEQRFYGLTHQVLFWQLMHKFRCIESVPEELQQRLCSNVMRDAKQLAEANFPARDIDLFLEQVGVCGFWGFRDFNQPEWLRSMLKWQHESGCYTYHSGEYCFDEIPDESRRRVKREEKELDDGCYSHTTGVSMLALVVSVRFEAEKLSQTNLQQSNSSYELWPLIFIPIILLPLIYICRKKCSRNQDSSIIQN